MNRIVSVIKENRPAFLMVLFVAVFYLFVFYADRAEKKDLKNSHAENSYSIVSDKEIKAKEDLFEKNIRTHHVFIALAALIFLLVVISGFALDGYLIGKKIKGQPLIQPTLSHDTVLWGLKDVAEVFAFLFFIESVILIVELLVSYFLDFKGLEKHSILMLNSLIRDVSAATFVIYLVAKRFKHELWTVGLTTKNFFKNVKIGVIGYLSIIPAILAVLFILSVIAKKFSYEPPVQPVVQIYLKESEKNYLLFFTLFVAIVGPIIEEVFFRGFTYKAFRQKWGVWRALTLSSGIFAALHMSLIGFLPIFMLGFFLAYLYEATGSLVPSMMVHMIHNLIMVSMTLIFKNYSG